MEEKQFNRARISAKDFEEALSYLNEYDRSLSETIRRALLISAIVAYARPFGKNEESPQATRSVVGNPQRHLGTNGYKLHKRIIGLRNEAVAHSEYKRNPTKAVEHRSTGFFAWSRFFDILSEELDIEALKENAERMKQHCEDKLFELNRIISSNKAN